MMIPKCCMILGAVLLVAGTEELRATQAIANWDVVPDQVIGKPFKVGVVAFHETGVSVEFQVNGKSEAKILEPTLNDQTKVWEYWFELDPSKLKEGPITVGATATPKGSGHEPRNLDPLTLHIRPSGSQPDQAPIWVDADKGSDETGNGSQDSPYATIAKGVNATKDGGVVYLKAGKNYKLTQIGGGSDAVYWTSVQAAPGLKADDVHILTYGPDESTTGRYGRNRIRWHNVSLFCDRSSSDWGSILYVDKGKAAWFDGSVLYDKKGRFGNTSLFNGADSKTYLTDCHIRDIANCGGDFQRNVSFENILSDIYRGSTNLTAINVTIRKIDKGDTAAHPDFIQFYNPKTPVENVILYNIKVYDMLAQGIFGAAGDVSDVALVNLLLEKDPPEAAFRSQVSGKWDHVLLWNATLVDQTFHFRDSKEITNFDVRNSVFASLSTDNVDHPSIHIDSAHVKKLVWDQKAPLGTHPTVGDPVYVDEASDDYRLSTSSPAYGTGILCPGVPADIEGKPYNPKHPNRGAFATME